MQIISDPVDLEDIDLTTPVRIAVLPPMTVVDTAANYLVTLDFTFEGVGTNASIIRAGVHADEEITAPQGTQVHLLQLTTPGTGVPSFASVSCVINHGETAKGLWLKSSNASQLSAARVSIYRQDVTHPVVTDASLMLVAGWRLVDLLNLTEGDTRVAGATLTVTNTDAGEGVVARVVSDAQGLARLFLLPGTYYRWAQHTEFSFTNPHEFVVEAED